ncbi:unnamed protein product [Sordaria macrospora k-hell]|uniref:WGS project CABT00000000 data, contig 2.22 n=1 Tax=Sordaria macrospora (strain ATCC MYA-333 / DSM 997 / K(L3346) / K-hell) TaxID=771870 RepID=F7W2P5_SORMK|nr:uncharacterized protein SMAC_05108 [Sordaria macrospora k-hell]CCC11896.1 unnamed protein product [Sordaria macrospora k-hell]
MSNTTSSTQAASLSSLASNDKPIVWAQEGPLNAGPWRGPSAGPWSYTQPRLEILLSAGMTGGRRIALLWWPGYCLVGVAGALSVVAGAAPEAGGV